MKRVWTENSHLGSKARLRADFIKTLGKTDLHILDAFAGDGHVWQRVQELLPDHKITYLGIDKKKYSRPEVIMGNNQKVMKGLDLNQFDLIDLDAFGFPWEQLQICAEQAPQVPVASTCISVTLGPTPFPVLKAAGIPKDWTNRDEVPHSLFNRWRWRFWETFCADLGYTTTDYEMHLDKPSVKRYEILTRDS